MEIIFHIGMGKTGTTSVQQALEQNSEILKEHGAQYVGMWFDLAGEEFKGIAGSYPFFLNSPEKMKDCALEFHQGLLGLQKATGFSKFIFSNETIFEHPDSFLPFSNELNSLENVNVKLVVYMRNPSDWIQSAYSQWGIMHKTVEGRIPAIKEFAGTVCRYDKIDPLLESFGGDLDVRLFDKSVDVVSDFGEAIGIELKPLDQSFLERRELAEMVLRREFNNSFEGHVFPDVFEDMVLGAETLQVDDLEATLASIFDAEAIREVVEFRARIWSRIKENFGIDLTQEESKGASVPDIDQLRNRLLDYLVSLVMKQSKELHGLKSELQDKDQRLSHLELTLERESERLNDLELMLQEKIERQSRFSKWLR